MRRIAKRRNFDAELGLKKVSITGVELRYGYRMVLRQQIEPGVAGVASQVLNAWKNGQRPSLEDWRAQELNAVETERMEVLQSVVESLQRQDKLSSDRVRTAVRLLEHLATTPVRLDQD